jgi:predicted TPR repeat methyltransferase
VTAREALSHSSSLQSDQYRTETREAYRNRQRAEAYDRQLLGSLSWARFTMWREIGLVASFIRGQAGNRKPLIIDLPCGTGVASRIFRGNGYPIIAGDISAEMYGGWGPSIW